MLVLEVIVLTMIKIQLLLVLTVVTGISCSPVQQAQEDSTRDSTLKAEAGITTHSTKNAFSSIWSSTDVSLLQTQSICLFAGDDEPMTQKVLEALTEQFNSASNSPEITAIPFGDTIPLGARLPDTIFTIKLQSADGEDTLLKATRTTIVHLSGGSQLMQSKSSFSDSLTPPSFTWSIDGTATNELEHEGIRIGIDLDAQSAKQLAQALDQAIQEKLKEFSDSVPDLGALPPYCYPAYQPQPLPEAVAALQPKQLLAGNRAFTPYESYWRLSTSVSDLTVLTSIRNQLESEGWVIKHFEAKENSIRGLRAMRQKNAEVISIWPEPDSDNVSEYLIHHQLRLSRTRLTALIDHAFEAKASLSLLAHFYRNWSPENQQRFIERAEQNPPHTALATWSLVNAYEKQGKPLAALNQLNLSYLLGRINGKHTDNRLTTKGEELSGDPDWEPSFPSEAALEALGIPNIALGAQIAPITLESGQLALFSTTDRNGNQMLAFFRIQPNGAQHYNVQTGRVALTQSQSGTTGITSECSQLDPIRSYQHLDETQLLFSCYRTPDAPETFTLKCEIK